MLQYLTEHRDSSFRVSCTMFPRLLYRRSSSFRDEELAFKDDINWWTPSLIWQPESL